MVSGLVAALESGLTSWCQILDALRLGPADDVAEVTAAKPNRHGPGRPLGSKSWRPAARYDVGKTARRPETIPERDQDRP